MTEISGIRFTNGNGDVTFWYDASARKDKGEGLVKVIGSCVLDIQDLRALRDWLARHGITEPTVAEMSFGDRVKHWEAVSEGLIRALDRRVLSGDDEEPPVGSVVAVDDRVWLRRDDSWWCGANGPDANWAGVLRVGPVKVLRRGWGE